MKRFTNLLQRTKSSSNSIDLANAPPDSPEVNVTNAIQQFCESGNSSNSGEEVLHLPVIVDGAESSPRAATAAAQQIRKFLGKEYATIPHVQYNSVMLLRILCDNPGPAFMRNFDKAFVTTVKECLRNCKDPGTQQILRETLDSLEVNKAHDEGIEPLLQMWRKEKGAGANLSGPGGPQNALSGQRRGQGPNSSTRNQLPTPAELANRIEEAKNTAQILLQFVQTTKPAELHQNDLIREFGERCQIAQKSMQGYINCTNPHPDDDTMQTLIEVNEQLSLAGSRYHRALLAARRAAGAQSPPVNQANGFSPPPQPPRVNSPASQVSAANDTYHAPSGPPPGQYGTSSTNNTSVGQNPFVDPGQPSTSLFTSTRPTQSFSIQAEPTYPARPPPNSHLAELENNFVVSPPTSPPLHGHSTPTFSDISDPYGTSSTRPTYSSDGYDASPQRTFARPALNPYHNTGNTPSYMGRQESAVNNLTMHGAQSEQRNRI